MSDFRLIEDNEYHSKVQKDENGNMLPYKITSNKSYPAIYLEVEQVSGYLAQLLKSVMQPAGGIDDLVYTVYVKTKNGVLKIGKSTATLLKIVLNSDMFNDWKVYVYLNENKKVSGDNLFALY